MSRSRINRSRARRTQLHSEATERAHERAGLTAEDQIAVLDRRLGKEVGASRERARLAREIERRSEASVTPTSSEGKKRASPKTRSERRKAKAKRNAEREQGNRPGG